MGGPVMPVASVDDLACMKLSAIANRGARRDFWDLHELISRGCTTLSPALEAFKRKYTSEDFGPVVKSLVYFADADAEPSPGDLGDEHWRRIKVDLVGWVAEL